MKKKRRTIELAQQTAEMFARCVAVLKPPPELTLPSGRTPTGC